VDAADRSALNPASTPSSRDITLESGVKALGRRQLAQACLWTGTWSTAFLCFLELLRR